MLGWKPRGEQTMYVLERLLLAPWGRAGDVVAVVIVAASMAWAAHIQLGIWKADAACPERIGNYCPATGWYAPSVSNRP